MEWQDEAPSASQDYARIYDMFGHLLGSATCEDAEVEATHGANVSTSSASHQGVLPKLLPRTRLSKLNCTDSLRGLASDYGFHDVPALHDLGHHPETCSDPLHNDEGLYASRLDRGEVQVVESESDEDCTECE